MVEVYKRVILVNEQDEIIGHEYLEQAKASGQLRRAARVFVFDTSGRFLVQQRSQTVFSPGLLDQSVGGHVDEGETYREAAEREMREELGIQVPIEEVFVSFRSERFFNGLYRAVIDPDTPIPFNATEVTAVLWYEIQELELAMQATPAKFTYSFLEIWPLIRDKIIPS